ncbi:MAG TPA: GNAT family N-acetyltransferase [Erysipelotrichaceae bacterium]|jgi:ElaA protein|nr:GNAT family N-acetyltransferase [Bacillota bacterium]NLP21599.1 GNAT family N-acetyltransferase [Erysipelotrichaceae bacterium]HCY06412.1 GNAT family N-acetyltransferase [Erysipelotrichaceae bacterium]
MELVVKHFNELNTKELFDIYKLRVSVFVVEQNCPYQEIDDTDLVSYHMYYKDKDGIKAYLRIVPKNVTMEDVSIGRVISMDRRKGLGSKLLNEGINFIKNKFYVNKIGIEAQVYAKTFYELQGFKQISDEFLIDDIPHIKMLYEAL